MEKIFGYSFEEIQSMQQKKYVPSVVTGFHVKSALKEGDKEKLAKHGKDGLEKLGLFGVLDRLKQNGLI